MVIVKYEVVIRKKSHKWNEETMCKKIFKKETFPLMVIVKYKAVILRRVTKETFSTMIIVKYDVVILSISIRLLFLEEPQKERCTEKYYDILL